MFSQRPPDPIPTFSSCRRRTRSTSFPAVSFISGTGSGSDCLCHLCFLGITLHYSILLFCLYTTRFLSTWRALRYPFRPPQREKQVHRNPLGPEPRLTFKLLCLSHTGPSRAGLCCAPSPPAHPPTRGGSTLWPVLPCLGQCLSTCLPESQSQCLFRCFPSWANRFRNTYRRRHTEIN